MKSLILLKALTDSFKIMIRSAYGGRTIASFDACVRPWTKVENYKCVYVGLVSTNRTINNYTCILQNFSQHILVYSNKW